MALLSSGHFATDFSNGALPALLPFLKDRFSLSYTAVGAVMLASQASSSLMQPLFGLWSDRRGAMWLLPAGVAVAGVGIALAADAPAFWLVLLFVLVSGLGSAAFHPEGSKFAGFVSGRRRASGMAWFSIGGNLGFAVGPIATTAVVAAFELARRSHARRPRAARRRGSSGRRVLPARLRPRARRDTNGRRGRRPVRDEGPARRDRAYGASRGSG